MTNISESTIEFPNPTAVYWKKSGDETNKLTSSESGAILIEMVVFMSPMKSVDAAAAYTAWNCVVMTFGHDQYMCMSFAELCRAFAVVRGRDRGRGKKKTRWTHKAEARPTTSPSRVASLLWRLVKPSSPSSPSNI